MANLSLPSSPTNGQVVTHENTKFVYSQSKDVWTRETLSTRIENVVPSTNESISSTGIIGSNLVFTKADGSTSNVSLQALAGGAVTVYANESDLPAVAQNGDHAFVTTTDDLYIRSSGAWRVIDAINLSPTITASLSTKSFTAAETIDITYTTSEPEGTPVTVTTSNTGISNTGQVTITHYSGNNTVTVLAGDQALSGGTLILSVTDGTNIGTDTITLDVSVGFDSGVSLQHQWGGTDTAFYGANATLSDDGMYLAISSLASNFGGGQPDSAGHIDIWISDGTTNSWTHQTTIDWNDFNSAFSGTSILQNNNTFARFKMQLNNDGSRLLVSNPYADIGGHAYRGTVALLSRSGTTWSFVQGTSNSSVPLAPSNMPVTGTNMATLANMYYGNQSAMANGTGNNNGQVIAANYPYNGDASTTPPYIQGNIISIYKHDRTDGKINNTSFQNIDFRTQTNNSFAPTRGQGQLAFSANGEWLAIGYNNTHQTGQSFASTTWNAADYHRGVVYLYKSTNASTRTDYTQQQYILGPTGHNGSGGGKFGRRVEMSDSGTLLVQQLDGDHSTISGATGVGRVYIYTLSGSTWSQLQILEAPTTGIGSNAAPYHASIETFHSFGHNMAISGDASYIACSDSDSKPGFESIIHIYKINGSNTYDLLDTITSDTNNTYHAEQFYFDNNMLSITSNGFLSFGIPNSDKHGTNDGQVTVYKA